MVLISGCPLFFSLLYFLWPGLAAASGSGECPGDLEDTQGSTRGWAITTKRICNTHTLPDWSVSGGDVEFTSSQFCMIAYKGDHLTNQNYCKDSRDIYAPVVKLEGDGSGDHYYLTNGSEKIPVSITLKRVDGRGEYPLSPNAEQVLPVESSKCVCNQNEYELIFAVDSDAIFDGSTGAISSQSFEGNFPLSIWNQKKTKYEVNTTIKVQLALQPAIQISGLEDIVLTESDGKITGSQDFCVFAVGTETFSLTVESREGNSSFFQLKKGNKRTSIKYQLNYMGEFMAVLFPLFPPILFPPISSLFPFQRSFTPPYRLSGLSKLDQS